MDVKAGRPSGTAVLIGVLLAAATIAFVWGTFAERSTHHDVHSESSTATTTTSAAPAASESSPEKGGESGPATTTPANGETPAQHAAESGTGTTPTASETKQETEYHPLGINLESTPLVITAALLALLLAGLVVLHPRYGVLIAVALMAAAFTILEVVHQTQQHRPGLATLAAVAGILHAAVALLAARQLVTPRPVAAI
jgi:Flp pilus assembly protein TadB